MNQNKLGKLNELGLWRGPHAFIADKMINAYQILGNRQYIGTFPRGVFVGAAEGFDNKGLFYLGKPSDLFTPRIGIDKIRNPEGHLVILESLDQLKPEFCEAHFNLPKSERPKRPKKQVGTGTAVPVKATAEQLVVYPLNHALQVGIVEPSSFEGYHVQISGLSPVGLEIARQLTKMGLTQISAYDPGEVLETDVASSSYRVFDPHRDRLGAAFEIIGDGSLAHLVAYQKYIDGAEEFGNIVVNADGSLDVRQNLWALVKKNAAKIGLYIDAQADDQTWRVFVINPQDQISIEAYETDLATSVDNNATRKEAIPVVCACASWAVYCVMRYLATPGNARGAVIDRMFHTDMQVMASEGGAFGKLKVA